MHVIDGGKATQPTNSKRQDVLLVCSNGTELYLPLDGTPRDFTYAGRLWAFNQPFSQKLGKPVYCEINAWVVDDMRSQANSVLAMAERYRAQLESLKTPAGQQQ